ncbi:MAG: zinc ribbon domain-containing protein [Desulfovibrio sp.]|nr:zinc ribbon domain-containing protein [Desulfovibrio sp.]
MPIYEYQCPQCGRIFEEWVKVADAHTEESCPDCGTSSPRLISHTSFVLKGGGWYVTDYGFKKNHEDGTSAGSEHSGSKNNEKTATNKDSAQHASNVSGAGKTNGSSVSQGKQSPAPKTVAQQSTKKSSAA